MNNHIYYCVLLRDKSTSEAKHKPFCRCHRESNHTPLYGIYNVEKDKKPQKNTYINRKHRKHIPTKSV